MTNLSNASGSAVVTVGGEFTMTNLSNASGSMSMPRWLERCPTPA
jgi:hypothetical protein